MYALKLIIEHEGRKVEEVHCLLELDRANISLKEFLGLMLTQDGVVLMVVLRFRSM